MQASEAPGAKTRNARLFLVDESRFVDCLIGAGGNATMQVRVRTPMTLPEDVILCEEATGLAFECRVNWCKHDLIGLIVVGICNHSRRPILLSKCAMGAAWAHETRVG
jgi:hypothetical protein